LCGFTPPSQHQQRQHHLPTPPNNPNANTTCLPTPPNNPQPRHLLPPPSALKAMADLFALRAIETDPMFR
jgi:hypothetical protein